MKALVVFDSVFGNTAQIGRAMAGGLGADALAKHVADVSAADLQVQVLLVGSPTRGFRPTPAIVAWLKALPAGALQGVKVAGFDTRADVTQIKAPLLAFMITWLGYAAPRISKRLAQKGGTVALPPEGFMVMGTEGPLKEGELERAAAWAKRILG